MDREFEPVICGVIGVGAISDAYLTNLCGQLLADPASGSRTWRLGEGGVRFFLLAGSERTLMVDSGMLTHDARNLA